VEDGTTSGLETEASSSSQWAEDLSTKTIDSNKIITTAETTTTTIITLTITIIGDTTMNSR